ncbi:Uncharacterised protein [Mycobacteroides abscessus subsp. massiliense]|nr:Uncharacterised protein [Mycobacteroides abscessus subsp. massiliense]
MNGGLRRQPGQREKPCQYLGLRRGQHSVIGTGRGIAGSPELVVLGRGGRDGPVHPAQHHPGVVGHLVTDRAGGQAQPLYRLRQ